MCIVDSINLMFFLNFVYVLESDEYVVVLLMGVFVVKFV